MLSQSQKAMLSVPLLVFPVWQALAASLTIESVTFHPPSDRFRFYHARVSLSAPDEDIHLTEASMGGRPDMFVTTIDDALYQVRPDGGVLRPANGRVPAGKRSVFHVRCPWTPGQRYEIALHGIIEKNKQEISVSGEAVAPDSGGFPFPGWSEHRVLVLREDHGIKRENEPFVLFLSDDADRVGSWKKELRVAQLDLKTGSAQEIPSQVLYEKRLYDTPELEKAHTTCEAAFLASAPAKGKSYYLIAYGNPDAAPPTYESDLSYRKREGGEGWVENAYYEAELHSASGQLNGWRSKVYGAGDRRDFGAIERKSYALHYNPDCWARNRSWTHTHGWNPPPHQQVEAGPVVVMTRRWGHLPLASEIEVEVVYHFFSQTPYVLVESTMDIRRDLAINALRNEEVVFSPSTEVDHVGWRDHAGRVAYQGFTQGPDHTPGIIEILGPDAPYVCMTREANKLGMASLRLSQHAGSREGDAQVIASTQTVIADYGWDFRYWSRSLVYPWGDHVPDHAVIINAGTYYGEKSAFVLFPLEEGRTPEKRLRYLEELNSRLRNPLRIDHQGAGPW